MQLSFGEQLALVILNSLALGAITVGVGFLASRVLEKYKARQSLLLEISKARIAAFANLVTTFERLRHNCERIAYHLSLQAKELFLEQNKVPQDEFSEVRSLGAKICLTSGNQRRADKWRTLYNQQFMRLLDDRKADYDRVRGDLNAFRDELFTSRSLLGHALDVLSDNYWELRNSTAKFIARDYEYKNDSDIHRSFDWPFKTETFERSLLRAFEDPKEDVGEPKR